MNHEVSVNCSILIEYPNLFASEFCTRNGVTDCVLFCRVAGPVRLNTRPLVTLPAASERAIAALILPPQEAGHLSQDTRSATSREHADVIQMT
jgi:hypothetical protein